eukprot:530105-Rhodomonas_salina.1
MTTYGEKTSECSTLEAGWTQASKAVEAGWTQVAGILGREAGWTQAAGILGSDRRLYSAAARGL